MKFEPLFVLAANDIFAAECQVMSEQQNQKAGSMQVGLRQVATIKHGLPRGSNANKTGRITAGKIHSPPHLARLAVKREMREVRDNSRYFCLL